MNRALVLTSIVLIASLSIAPHWSILLGIGLSLFLKFTPGEQGLIKGLSSRILQGSIILLGSALNFQIVVKHGLSGMVTTFISLSLVLLAGELLARLFRVASPISTLISVGTAICGGSAIGAVSPVIKADNFSIAVAMGIVFILNASAVFIFPFIGNELALSQEQFGIWSALAIHDTSAVVAAAASYGEEALSTATTLKLSRALWIIPVTFFYATTYKSKGKITYPWFILFFLGMSLLFTNISELWPLVPTLKTISRVGFSVTLFLIGLSLNRKQLQSIKLSTVALGISLWVLTLSGSLFYVYYFIQK